MEPPYYRSIIYGPYKKNMEVGGPEYMEAPYFLK
jgi:hypothetical protein